ncbi:hypothetical protein GCM10007079_14670 [Nocardiopsis terrae]|uniref:Roadblock/LAMTOR2 domain-containing protein n=1 Tax=Nocardiopsis terrae TaxID=372655 RepID=A0ABR9HC04_9ACTN|nr:hypothetical protein [Nocardiopsis terrae]MBE1456330.1 hypothetical protein [Nocardiopsis terrae]GHC77455.1 hypothetical protein GCM10007079_14670 [Nocardiopsis terrae]
MLAIDQQMREMLHMPGVSSVCLIDWRSGRALTRVGAGGADGVTGTAAILQAIHSGPLCTAQSVEDVVVTEGDHHLLFAVLRGSEFCVQVRLERDRGNLGFALRRLRSLAEDVEVPHRDRGGPPRRGRGSQPRPRALVPVDRPVLERVLAALRTLSLGRAGTGTVVA